MKKPPKPLLVKRLATVSSILLLLLAGAMITGISMGSSGGGFSAIFRSLFGGNAEDSTVMAIIWGLRFPRVLLAALLGAALSLGGLVFQALLRNPLAEPYILGISGGSAIGAILGILAGFSRFPGVTISAFTGSALTLVLILIMSSGQSILKKNALLLSGVMVNAFCSAVIMFLISMTQDSRLHNILFWLMGDLSMIDIRGAGILAAILLPCFIVIFMFSNTMNLMLMGKEMARTMGVNIKVATILLLTLTSLMVSATVSQCGLIGFVGLVIPHILRLALGPDHRVLTPACVLGGATYMILCDLLARILPEQGEMPAGVITALIGAPIFIILLKRSKQ
ncbi:MAG: iron ABC transporter permease [Desulfobacterales bacterium]|nr:iron ABC transporter permease [Desulfobacterales bacterium]